MIIRKKIKLAACMLALVVLISCNALPNRKSSVDIPTSATVKSLETQQAMADQNWVIFPAKNAERIEIASWLFESDGYWTPSVDDILKIEENIAEYLSQNSNKFYWQPPVWQRLDEYQRQYIGLERGGKQIIYGNYFCEGGNSNWRNEFVFAIDGGECYFQVEYDLQSGLFIKLQVNGEA